MSTDWLILAILGGSLGLWRSTRRPGVSRLEHAAAFVLPALLVGLLFIYRETAYLSARWVWSACRLAPALAWLQGYPLYSPVDHGPINGWLYGPVAAVAWLPAALAGSPQTALRVAAVISLLAMLVPLAAAALRSAPGSPYVAGFAFAAGAAGLLQVYPTWYMASALNADAIAVGLGAASCLLLLGDPPQLPRLVVTALFGALAVWTKQVEAPLVLAQLGWLWFRRDRRTALLFAAAYAGAMLAVAALVFGLMNARDVIFNLWTVPSQHPLPGGWRAAADEFTALLRYTLPFWATAVIILVLDWKRPFAPAPGSSLPRPGGTGLFLLAALVLLPTGIMATIKLGGDRNSLHSVYYLLAAALVAVAGGRWTYRPAVRLGGLLLLAVVTTGLTVRQVHGYGALSMLPPRCLSEEAWTYARAHPHRAYFPWDPLATLLAEGKMYHFEYGVYDRTLAGRAPTAAHLAAGLPERPELIIYPKADYPRTMLGAFPQHSFLQATDDWLLFRANPASPP